MSQTRAVTAYNVRVMIDDSDMDDFAINSLRMNQFIQGQMHLLAGRMVLPMEAVTSVAVTAGTYDYTLSGTVADVRKVLWNATGAELEPMTFDDIASVYLQDTAITTSGTPEAYALYETSAQASKLRLAPTPSADGTLKLHYGIIPTALTTDISTIPFSAPMLRILEMMVASECISIMSPDDRKRRMVSTDIVKMWGQMIQQGLQDENMRMRGMGSLQRRIHEVEV
jgi:hypothetical protein